jgi:hypothetical protein
MQLRDTPSKTPNPKPLCQALLKLKSTMPPIFAGTALDRLTGQAYRWRTLQNQKSRGDAPADMFLRHGSRKLLVDRDRFLEYWQQKLTANDKHALRIKPK